MNVLLEGLMYTVVGMVVVFFGLSLLIACVSALHRFCAEKKAKIAAPAAAPVASAEPMPVAVAVQDDGEIVAAITAAITLLLQEENNGQRSGFTVRRIRRVSSGSAWMRAGREEQIFSRM